ncbi:tyrosine-type recombinase/integrase [Dactylosporangium vinaceum]|nr:tyrosine-type recombinase/integrase [Dactylosporangium vinaceum]
MLDITSGKPRQRTVSLLFTTRHGNPITDRIWWRERASRAGHRARRLHPLRHFLATTLISQHVEPQEVQRALRHKTLTMTLGTYVHWRPKRSRQRGLIRGGVAKSPAVTEMWSGGSWLTQKTRPHALLAGHGGDAGGADSAQGGHLQQRRRLARPGDCDVIEAAAVVERRPVLAVADVDRDRGRARPHPLHGRVRKAAARAGHRPRRAALRRPGQVAGDQVLLGRPAGPFVAHQRGRAHGHGGNGNHRPPPTAHGWRT